MKFLNCKNIKKELSSIKSFLRNKGVYVYTTDDFSDSPDFDSITGIWVVFDNQYSDAYQLLKNKNHIVSNPLTKQEMVQIENKSKEDFFKSSQSFFERLFTVLLILIIISFILYVVLS